MSSPAATRQHARAPPAASRIDVDGTTNTGAGGRSGSGSICFTTGCAAAIATVAPSDAREEQDPGALEAQRQRLGAAAEPHPAPERRGDRLRALPRLEVEQQPDQHEHARRERDRAQVRVRPRREQHVGALAERVDGRHVVGVDAGFLQRGRDLARRPLRPDVGLRRVERVEHVRRVRGAVERGVRGDHERVHAHPRERLHGADDASPEPAWPGARSCASAACPP